MSERPTSGHIGKFSKTLNKPLNLSISRRIRRRRTFGQKGQSLPPAVEQNTAVQSNVENQPARYYYAPIWNPPVATPDADSQRSATSDEANCENDRTPQSTQEN